MKWSEGELEYLRNTARDDPKDVAAKLGRSVESVQKQRWRQGLGSVRDVSDTGEIETEAQKLATAIKQRFAGKRKGEKVQVFDLADSLDVAPRRIVEALALLGENRSAIREAGGYVFWGGPESGGETRIDISRLGSTVIRFGVASDKHLASKYARLDVLEALYDVFAGEGIETVYDAGNWIDGEARFNKNDLLYHGKPNQLRYWAKVHPRREGMTTYFIAGEDHEGWYTRQDGDDIGWEAQKVAEDMGRDDLKYLGFMEHDVVVPAEKGDTRIRIVHPGGGSSYALSYKPQKLIESYTGGEKPQILIIGHYHKQGYFSFRNVHAFLAGTTQDQTPFMRKLQLAAAVGGWIIEATQAPDGSVQRIRSEFISFYDREYYQRPWEHQMYHPDLLTA